MVTLEICKILQSQYIQNDAQLFTYEEAATEQSPTPIVSQTNIVEELG
jgi:hypothetical protein